MKRLLLGVGIAFSALASAQRAEAGAWLAPEDGQQIWTLAVSSSEEWGAITENAVYWEAPFGEDYSLVATPWVETSAAHEDGWRGEAVIGVKRALFRSGPNVAAVQGGVVWRSDAYEGCGEGGVELRWLRGRSLGEHGFVNFEVAARGYEGGCGGARVDFALGFRPRDNWLSMAELFFDAGADGEDSIKVQFSLVRFEASGAAVQIGVRARLASEDAEPALVLAMWEG